MTLKGRVSPLTLTKIKIGIGACIIGLLFIGLGAFLRSSTTHKEAKASAHVESVAYENQLSACEGRGNEIRRVVYELAGVDTQLERPDLARRGRQIRHRMATAPYALANGEIACLEAVTKP
jgi:hypothetical protein